MAFTKIVLFLGCLSLALANQPIIFKDEIKNILSNIPVPYNQTEDLQSLRNRLIDSAETARKNFQRDLNELEERYKDNLQNLRDNIEKSGGNVDSFDSCVEKVQPYVDHGYLISNETFNECNDGILEQGLQAVDGGLEQIMNIYNKFQRISQNVVMNCALSPNVDCFKSIVELTVVGSLFEKIGEISSRTKNSVSTLTSFVYCRNNINSGTDQTIVWLLTVVQDCYSNSQQ